MTGETEWTPGSSLLNAETVRKYLSAAHETCDANLIRAAYADAFDAAAFLTEDQDQAELIANAFASSDRSFLHIVARARALAKAVPPAQRPDRPA